MIREAYDMKKGECKYIEFSKEWDVVHSDNYHRMMKNPEHWKWLLEQRRMGGKNMNMNPIPEQEYSRKEIISSSMKLDTFTVEPGVEYAAPEGKTLTMVVDGVETAMRPGTYRGTVLLCVRDVITPPFAAGYFTKGPVFLRAGLYVDRNGVRYDSSVEEAWQGAGIDDQKICGGKLISRGPLFGGMVIQDREYRISRLSMDLSGRGGDDFIGVGAGLLIGGSAKVTVEDCSITTTGCIRPALTVGGTAQVVFRDCEVMANGGGATEEAQTPGMNTVPWPLGLSGNCRATNLVKGAHVRYENCRMRSYGWGVLSTDDPTDVDLYAKDCLIEITGPSGYGSYSVGDTRNTFDHCTIRVPDYALIVAEAPGGGVFTGGTTVFAGRNAIMWHSNRGGLTTVDSGCRLHANQAVFMVKSCAPRLRVMDSQLISNNHTILQLMDSDDAGLFSKEFIVPDGASHKQEDFDVTKAHESDMYAVFSDMSIDGDFYNGTTGKFAAKRDEEPKSTATNLVLELDSVMLNGTITSSKVKYCNMAPGEAIKPENNKELGRVENTPIPAVNNGVIVTLKHTTWMVTGTSYLTSLQVDASSHIIGRVTVNGKEITPQAGEVYVGVITVAPDGP